MKKKIFTFFFLLSLTNVFSFQDTNEQRKQVELQSQKFAKALEVESLVNVLTLFGPQAALLPEYHKSLFGRSKIKEYYAQFFEKCITTSFSKSAFEIIPLGGEYVLELGTFEHNYQTPQGNDFEYSGKYMTYWKFLDNGTPKISAHIWGASNYFEAENLNFISVDVPDTEAIIAETHWEKDIEEIRKFVYKAVFSGDSKKQLITYADDAIYMTYYDPPFIGKEKIAAYFNAHYNRDVPMDSLMTKNIKVINMGDHALKFGEYRVEWTWEGQPSYIEGKGLSLYKKIKDGTIKIYRQMINHSMPASRKK